MYKHLIFFVIVPILFVSCKRTEEFKKESIKEETEWSHTWMVHTNKSDLPRVLIIGDSHVERYCRIVSEELDGLAYCCKLTTSKSLGDPILIDEIELVLKQYDFDVISFNNGLHGKDYTEEQYGSYIPTVYELFKKYSNAEIVWVNTTALRDREDLASFHDFNSRIIKRNELVLNFCKTKNIPVVNLYSLSLENQDFFQQDGCHFNTDGVVAEGKLVAAEVLRVLHDTE